MYTRVNKIEGGGGMHMHTCVRMCMCIYTCMRVLMRSMGAVATAATVPEIKPPATKCSVRSSMVRDWHMFLNLIMCEHV